jgi:hypothetical protein
MDNQTTVVCSYDYHLGISIEKIMTSDRHVKKRQHSHNIVV